MATKTSLFRSVLLNLFYPQRRLANGLLSSLPKRRASTLSTEPGFLCSVIEPFNAIRLKLGTGEGGREIGWTIEEFREKLKFHINQWVSEKRSAIWLHIPLLHCALVHEAVNGCGFTIHHALNNEIVLSRWLREDTGSKIPPFASHQVGVCGVVFREDTKEILVTQDKYKSARWKFPGGISEFAEDITDTAEREVLEETGIIAEAQSIIAFRQHHHMPIAFGRSDLYFICRMKPLTFDITPCPTEIFKCEWVGLRELQVSPLATILTNRIAELMLRGYDGGFREADILWEEHPSILPDHTYKLFLTRMGSEEREKEQ